MVFFQRCFYSKPSLCVNTVNAFLFLHRTIHLSRGFCIKCPMRFCIMASGRLYQYRLQLLLKLLHTTLLVL